MSIDSQDNRTEGEETQSAEQHAGREIAKREDILLDALTHCLVRMTFELNRPVSEADVRNAVPTSPSGMTLDQFLRAAARLDYQVRVVDVSQRAVKSMPAPFVLVGREAKHSKVVVSRLDKKRYLAFDPTTMQDIELTLDQILTIGNQAVLMKASGATAPDRDWRALMGKRIRGVLGELLIASFVINILALGTPLFAMTVYNKVIGQQALDTLQILAAGVLAVYIFDALLRGVRSYISTHTGARLDALIGSEVMHHFVHLPFAHFERTPSGLIAERLRQLETVRSFFTGQMPMLIIDLAFVAVFVTVLFFIHTTIAWITVSAMPLFIGVSALFHKRQLKLIGESFRAQSTKFSHINELVANALTVKAMGLEPEMERRWDSRLALGAYTGFRAQNISNFVSTAGHFLQLVTSLVILYFGAQLVIAGEMTIGALIAGNILATRALAPLRMVATAWVQVQEVKAAFRRIDDIMLEATESPPGRTAPAPRFQGKLALENVNFTHAPDLPPVLKDVSLTIQPGTIMGIIGPSGSGKTTLVRLLQGLYNPTGGRVLMDDTDINHISKPALRQQLGVVPQETQLFAGTVRENILMGSPVKDPERVMAVAKFVGAHDFIQRLPNGYDTPLSERGVGLSAGQRQLICVARALIRNPRILILDEASSDLDAITEENLMRNLKRASRGRTIVIVSHRMAPFVIADRVALLMDGQIERIGPPAEVVAFAKSRMAEANRGSS